MKTYHIFPYAFLLSSSLSFFSCDSSILLQENFSSDIIGTRPITDIPGDPRGDLVNYNPAINNRLKIVASGSNKNLEFSAGSAGTESGHNNWLSFQGVSTDLGKPLAFFWTGKISRGENDLLGAITDGYDNAIARFTINRKGEIRLCSNSSDRYYTLQIGTIKFDEFHNISIYVDPLKNTYTIGISGHGVYRFPKGEDYRTAINITRDNLFNLIIAARERETPPKPELVFNWTREDNIAKYNIASVKMSRL